MGQDTLGEIRTLIYQPESRRTPSRRHAGNKYRLSAAWMK